MPNVLRCPNLTTHERVRHGFFTRMGGVSGGLFGSLNCGPRSGDNIEDVLENRARVVATLDQPNAPLCTLYQIHSAQVVTIDRAFDWQQAPQGDALVTNKPGIVLGVLTADCVPVLFSDAKAGVIAAAHAGWKGAFDGVLEATIEAMHKLGAVEISASIGPAIAQASYEVGPEFCARFLQQSVENHLFFLPSVRQGHHLFDVQAYVKNRLQRAGIGDINHLAEDTCLKENTFFSYRRSCLRGENAYGRQVSAITLIS